MPYIKEHGQYAALVSTEGDGTVIDFLALWTMAIYPLSKRKFYFQDVAYEKAVYENGLTYTIDDKGEYVDLVEGIYSRERTKALALEHLKESSFAIKQRPSTASTDSLETLTNEPAPIDSAKTCNIQTSFLETSPLDKLREEEALLQKQESLLEKDMYDILSKAEKLASQANTDLTNGRDDGMEIYRYIKLAIIGLSFVVGFFAWTQYSVVQMEGNYSA